MSGPWKARRLRGGTEIQKVLRQGLRLDGRHFVLFALDRERPPARLGLAVGRKVGGAVQRNRAKRLLREAFRALEWARPTDFVAVAKADLPEQTRMDVERELVDRVRRLAGRPARRKPAARRD